MAVVLLTRSKHPVPQAVTPTFPVVVVVDSAGDVVVVVGSAGDVVVVVVVVEMVVEDSVGSVISELFS